MNDVPFRKMVTSWMADEAYRRLRISSANQNAPAARKMMEDTGNLVHNLARAA